MIKTKHAFHDLLPREAALLRRRALKLTTNEHHAQDLVQATLLKAWANRDSYHPDTNLRAWLFTIMRNTFFSDLRKLRREVEDVDGLCAKALSEGPRQVDAIALKELIAAIAGLPRVQSRPLVLMGALGFSQLEAARACGCTIGTIKSRVSRSRATLSLILDHDTAPPGARLPPVRRIDPVRQGARGYGAPAPALAPASASTMDVPQPRQASDRPGGGAASV